jgi:hypothetical protein
MVAMSVSLGSIVVLPTFGLIVAAGAIGGAGSGFVFVPWLVFIQHQTEDEIRGRVLAAADAFDQSAFLVGLGLAVPVLSWVGPHSAYGVAGALLALAAVMAAFAALEASDATRPAGASFDADAANEVKFIPGATD